MIVSVRVWLGVNVRVSVGVIVGVNVGEGRSVLVGTGVTVGVTVLVGVNVIVGVSVTVGVLDGVRARIAAAVAWAWASAVFVAAVLGITPIAIPKAQMQANMTHESTVNATRRQARVALDRRHIYWVGTVISFSNRGCVEDVRCGGLMTSGDGIGCDFRFFFAMTNP